MLPLLAKMSRLVHDLLQVICRWPGWVFIHLKELCVSIPLNSDIFLKDLTASNGSISGNVIQLEIQGMQSPCFRQRHIFLQPVSKSDFFSAIKGQEGLRWLYWAGFPRLVILAVGHIAMPEASKFLPFLVAAWRAHWLGQVSLWCDDLCPGSS